MPLSPAPTPPQPVRDAPTPALPLPPERDENAPAAASAPDPVIAQAKRDLDAGQVDTDMRATAGLDAERRARLVPGPGGKPPGAGR